MRRLPLWLATGLFAAAATAHAAPVSYVMDPGHTLVLFSWNHFGFSHPTANLGLGEGHIVFDAQQPAKSSVEVSFPLDKLDTHVPALDQHLKAADFFDAAKYPTLTFKSTKVQSLGQGRFRITGDLTAHGITKPVVLNAKLNKQGEQPLLKKQAIGFDATGRLKRSAFGLGAYVPAVSDEISLHITTEAEVAQ